MYSFSIIPLIKKLENNREKPRSDAKNKDPVDIKVELEIKSIKSYSERSLALLATKFYILMYRINSNILSTKAQMSSNILGQFNSVDDSADFLPTILTAIRLSKDHQIFDFAILPSFGDW